MKRLGVVLAAAACGGGTSVPTGERVGPALSGALAGADQEKAPWRCAAADGPVLVDETIAGWKAAGHTLTRDGKGAVRIAVVADAGGAAAPTIAALGRLRPKLDDADLVIALGGMGTTQAELEATLGSLAGKAPLVALPGDLEDAGALVAAASALRAKGHPVIDGRLAQRIELPGASIATVAGASSPGRLIAGGDGCAYAAADATRAMADLTARPGLRILVSSEAPRGTASGEAVGELVLTPRAGVEIDLVLHGPTEPAATPAATGGREAKAVALTPGSADATPRLPGGLSASSAALLVIDGARWSWKPVVDRE